jgi:hypothetical protein
LELHDYTPEEMDEYLHKELELPRGGELAKARVLKCSRDGDGVPTGYRHEKSILNTRQFEVEFQDGSVDTYTVNVIAENLLAMVDPEGRQLYLTISRARGAKTLLYRIIATQIMQVVVSPEGHTMES